MNDKGLNDRQLILLFSSNADFVDMIEDLIFQWGYNLLVIDGLGNDLPSGNQSYNRHYAEPIGGSGGIIIEKISRLRPFLLLFDIESERIPWVKLISILSAVPATRRIPIVSIGKPTSVELLRLSEQVGAVESVAHMDLDAKLLRIMTKYARAISEIDYSEPCSQQLSEEALSGLEAFNNKRYYDAHEYLEHAWMNDETTGKDLYRAILQISVAYYQITRGNYRGAVKMFWRIRQWIEPLPETCRGVDVQRLRRDSSLVYQEIIRLGPQRIREFDSKSLQPIEYEV